MYKWVITILLVVALFILLSGKSVEGYRGGHMGQGRGGHMGQGHGGGCQGCPYSKKTTYYSGGGGGGYGYYPYYWFVSPNDPNYYPYIVYPSYYELWPIYY